MSRRAIRRRQRGATLIEGLAAAAVLTIGLLGALQSFLLANKQNTLASRITRGAAIADSLRGALDSRGHRRLFAEGGVLDEANCTTDALDYLGAEVATPPDGCAFDLDALEDETAAANRLMQTYSADDRQIFRRIVAIYPDPDASQSTRLIVVAVSWVSGGTRQYHYQFLGLYDPRANQTDVEI